MPNLDLRRPAAVGLALLSAILVLGAGSAGAAGTLVAYNMYPLVSDGATVSAPLTDPAFVNGWGLSASATSPWWSSNQRTNTSTLYTGVGIEERPRRDGRRGADRHDREREHDRLPSQPERRQWGRTLPVRHAGWTDPRLDADGERDELARRRRQLRRRGESTPASRPRMTGSTRPTSTTPASTRSTPRSSRSGSRSRIRTSRPAGRRSASRRSAGTSSSPTPSRIRRRRTPFRAAGSATSTSSAPTGRC